MFVNRVEEISAFKAAIQESLKQEAPIPKVICYRGLLGVGKTSLLKYLYTEVMPSYEVEVNSKIHYALAGQEQELLSPIELMVSWAEQLNHTGLELKEFGKKYQKYRQLLRDIESEGIPGVTNLLAKAAMKASLTVADAYTAGLVTSVADKDTLTEGAGNLADSIHKTLLRKGKLEDKELLLDPISNLTPIFVNELKDGLVILFMDHYERISDATDRWLRKLVEDTVNVLWIVASWGGLSGEWTSQGKIYFKLEGFEEGHISELIQKSGMEELLENIPAVEIGRVHRETCGLPYALDIEITLLRGGQIMGARHSCQAFANRIEEWIRSSVLSDHFNQIRKCSVARRLDEDLLVELLEDEVEAEKLWQKLKYLPLLVEADKSDNEEMDRFDPIFHTLMVKSLWHDSRRRKYREAHQRLENAYRRLLEEDFPDVNPFVACLDLKQTRWWTYYLEWSYHNLSLWPENHLPKLLDLIVILIDTNDSVLRSRFSQLVKIFKDVSAERTDADYLLSWANRIISARKSILQVTDSPSPAEEDYRDASTFWEDILSLEGISVDSQMTALNELTYIAQETGEPEKETHWQQRLLDLQNSATAHITNI